jgi:hypothetical protein
MLIIRQKSVRRLAVLGLFAILAVAAYGFAASNTVEDSNAGDGEGLIEGFDITDIDYTLDNANPGFINEVTFTIDPEPLNGQVWVQFQRADNTEIDSSFCTVAAGVATCDTALSANVLEAVGLRVVAVD